MIRSSRHHHHHLVMISPVEIMDCRYSSQNNNDKIEIHQSQNNGFTKCQLQNELETSVHLNYLAERQQQQQQQQRFPIQQNGFCQQQPTNTNLLPRPLMPIDDFHLLDNPNKYSDEERQLRIKLTAVYRLIEINGWSMGIYNHVTAKLENTHERILIHPFGLHYNEITGSSLLKIDMSGNIVDQGSTNFELNRPGYIVHSAIHMARPDLKAVIHLHFPPVAAVSACKYGLLPVCQEQALLGEIAYLDYSGILTQEDERDAVAAGLGKSCKVMILRNHGLIVCGETVEEAFYLLSNLMRACETQARLLALGGIENLVLMSEDAANQAYTMVQNARYPIKQLVQSADLTQGAITGATTLGDREEQRGDESTTSGNESGSDLELSEPSRPSKAQLVARKGSLRKSIIGYVNMYELDFEAQMRALDSAGHQTGYKFKRPLIRHYGRAKYY